jgi:hypothetical protein
MGEPVVTGPFRDVVFCSFAEFIFRLWVYETNLNSSCVYIFDSIHKPLLAVVTFPNGTRAKVMTSTFTLTSLSRITQARPLIRTP